MDIMKAARLAVILMILTNVLMFVGKLIIPELGLHEDQHNQLYRVVEALSSFLAAVALFINPDGTSAKLAWRPKGVMSDVFGVK